ncbi:uncharacterized protein [Rutidosis leptorrhynchoides]|uniref:uncharacterized protein n=1 Tax=Rutidosis leptorrhynchoides TaxID=125765 RepID=UPI003A98E429
MVNLHSSNDARKKRLLWDKLLNFMNNNEGEYVLFGDFNEVREESEKFGSIFHPDEANVFNLFIGSSGLVDIPLGGRKFTWMNKSASKMSRIDRVLVTSNIFEYFADLKLTTLVRGYSNHLPLLLQDLKHDFGPTPFKCFNSWYLFSDFDAMVKDASSEIMDNRAFYHDKMKLMKQRIKKWVKSKKANMVLRKVEIFSRINDIDILVESGNDTEETRIERRDLMQELDTLNRVDDMDIIRKFRVKWDAEGDENSKYFHCLLKQRRNGQMIKGITVNGEWLTDPNATKQAFFEFYANKFAGQSSTYLDLGHQRAV